MNIRGLVWSVLLNIQEIKSKYPKKYEVRSARAQQTGQAVRGPGLQLEGTSSPAWGGGEDGQMHFLGTDGDIVTTDELGSGDPPWLQ